MHLHLIYFKKVNCQIDFEQMPKLDLKNLISVVYITASNLCQMLKKQKNQHFTH